MLPTAPVLAADGEGAGNNSSSRWTTFAGNCVERIAVGVIGTIAGIIIKEWWNPSDPNDAILKRDKAIENTRQHEKDFLNLANATSDKELAAEYRKKAEFAGRLVAQGITLRNEEFAKICSKQNQSDTGK